MILKVLFIQRKESYEGKYAPEALCCIDEWKNNDSPEWFGVECNKQLKDVGDDAHNHKVIDINVDQDKIRDILLNNPTIQGEIK